MPTERPIVVVGSLNVDLAVHADRFPAPGETLRGQSFHQSTGGKGANQAAAAARLGYSTRMIGYVGEDDFAATVRSDLAAADVDCTNVGTLPGSTGVALITTAENGENTIVLAAGANDGLTPAALDCAWPLIEDAGMVLAQLEIPLETISLLAERCRAAGLPLMLDPAPARPLPPALLDGLAWITPNQHEAETLTGISLAGADGPPPEDALHRIADHLLKAGVKGVLLKLGAHGAFLATSSDRQRLSVHRVEVRDTTGAGDCTNAALAVALLRGQTPVDAARFAMAAAALSTTRRGALQAMPSEVDVHALLRAGGSR